MTKNERTAVLALNMDRLGISIRDSESLRRIEMTLHSWGERECNGNIQRDENTGKTYSVHYVGQYQDQEVRHPTADRETGALNRLKKIMSRYPKLLTHHQSDPRGCALYVIRKADVKPGEQLDSVYTRGVAVCL